MTTPPSRIPNPRRHPSLHSNFFSSLAQVEKRLKLDNSSAGETGETSTESLISPLFLNVDQNHSYFGNLNSNFDNSETPVEFLSNSIDFPQTQETIAVKSLRKIDQNEGSSHYCRKEPVKIDDSSKNDAQIVENDVDEIGLLVKLLGLTETGSSESKGEEMSVTCSLCHCEGGFYEKVVGVKGPKCGKEMERLDGWIKHFRDKKVEPFRLAHLLLGKATCVKGGDDDDGGGFEMVEFPSTVEEFLLNDPPVESIQDGIHEG